ncbi:hypothetical protein DMA15_11195 [Streptomyces sp. WAC 01529]|uniref:hypothetical protein n=1 Tax=Streptomyces sp. WAC 01529 TaxID=2203205 RepID=UPI000F6EE95C|nr:hypothetical protein [Streptomyces sp. WAC 01529]AZM53090.1 hypothetical protein DMA15_11195 [Streptomyces sp. WAC 01529]
MGNLGVWAAWAAALTSAATLIVTTVVGGRREHRLWVRDALTDAFVAFLEASWEHSDLFHAQSGQSERPPAGATEAYAEMRSQLTRLRLLASGNVLRACEELLRQQRGVAEAGPGEARRAALARVSELRRKVVAAAKTEMGL